MQDRRFSVTFNNRSTYTGGTPLSISPEDIDKTKYSYEFAVPIGDGGDSIFTDFVRKSIGGTFDSLIGYTTEPTISTDYDIVYKKWVEDTIASSIGATVDYSLARPYFSSTGTTPLTYNQSTGEFTLDPDLSQYDNSTSLFITDYTVTESDVTAHEAALSLTVSQLTDFSTEFNSAFDTRFGISDLITLGTKRHNDLTDHQGGTTNQYYHLTSAQHTLATQYATTGQGGLLSQVDWNTFNTQSNLWTITGSDIYRISKVGIGTTTPRVDLDVLGTIYQRDPIANVKAFGATGDGITDDTVAVQAALTASNNVYFPTGTYITKLITVTKDNTHVYGDGGSSIIQLKTGETGVTLDTSTYVVVIENLRITGGVVADYKVTGVMGNDRSGLYIKSSKKSIVNNLIIDGFENTGILVSDSTTSALLDRFVVSNIHVRDCWVGIDTGLDGENYSRYSNLNITRCRYAFKAGQGNVNLNNSNIYKNYYGIYLDGDRLNDGHGNINSCLINHNTNAIYAVNVSGGYTIVGNNIFEGIISLITCTGFTISNSTIDVTEYVLSGGGKNWIMNNHIKTSYGSTITHNSGGFTDYTTFINNYYDAGTYLESRTYPLLYNGNIDINTGATTDTSYINLGTYNLAGTTGGGVLWKTNYTGFSKISAAIRQVGEGSFFRSGIAFYTGNNSDLTTDAVERMRLTMDGRLGIGTTTPSYLLDVNGTARITGATTLSSTLAVTGTSNFTGNVGIGGAYSSSYNLYVTGAFRCTGIARMPTETRIIGSDTSNFTAYIRFTDSAETSYGYIGKPVSSLADIRVFAESGGGLSLHTNGNSSAVLYCDTSYNVGIGDTSPSYKLDVNGTFRTVGNAQFDGNLTIGGSGKYLYLNGTGVNLIDTDTTLSASSDARLATQKALKTYIDNVAVGVSSKEYVVCATTANITLSGEQTIDSVTTSADRVLVKNQTNATENGIYVSAAGAWTRATDFDEATFATEIPKALVFVQGGTVNSGWRYYCTAAAGGTLGVNNIDFVAYDYTTAYTAGNGLSLAGAQFSINTTITADLSTAQIFTNKTSYNGLVITANTGEITTGTWSATAIGPTRGGTGQTTYIVGDILYCGTTDILNKRAGNTTSTRKFLRSVGVAGVATAPDWDTLLSSDVVASYSGIPATLGATILGANSASTVVEFTTTGTGSVVLNNSTTLIDPILGTPLSGTLTNCTGLPVGGITGLGTGIATFLATPSSANLYTALTDKQGSGGLIVFATSPTITSPTLVTPVLGVATATSINKLIITSPATSATLTIADGLTLSISTANKTITGAGTSLTLNSNKTFSGTTGTITLGSGANNLTILGGTGNITLSNNTYALTLVTTNTTNITLPTSGTLSTLAGTENLTNKTIGTGSTWNGNVIGVPYGGTGLSILAVGDILYANTTTSLTRCSIGASNYVLTSSGTAPQWTANTGTGNVVRATSPTLVTPVLGVATATSINKVTITAPATSSTLTVANGKALISNTNLTVNAGFGSGTEVLTISHQGDTTITLPSGTKTLLAIDSYAALTTMTLGSTITWDCTNGAINKTMTVTGSGTLSLISLSNGMSGDCRLNVTSISTITISAGAITDIKGNGIITDLDTGYYHLCWTTDGSTWLDWNIANYDT